MTYELSLVTPPAIECVSLDEAKLHCRIDGTDEDALIHGLIRTARTLVEQHSLHALITQTWDLKLHAFPACDHIEIPLPPLQSVTSVKYKNSAGSETTWGTSNYIVDTGSRPGRVVLAYGITWPTFTAYPSLPVTVRFVAGYGSGAGDTPEEARQAMLLLIAHWYDRREATAGGSNLPKTIPFAVDALLADLRARAKRF